MPLERRSVTVGVDGSDGGRRALAWAVRYAAATGSDLDVVTAWSWDGMAFAPGVAGGPNEAKAYAIRSQRRDIKAVLAGFAGAAPKVNSRIVEGSAAKVLAEAAQSSDLLVVGSHGRGYLATALLGSVSEACVRRGSTPVVVVPARERVAAAA
jgi:nucleotide-binding universal stress UspA family protein